MNGMKRAGAGDGTPVDLLSAENITFAAACRENTGMALCDSGGAYGRSYEQPPVKGDGNAILRWDEGCPATMETSQYLADHYEINRELQKEFEVWEAEVGEEGNKKHEGSWLAIGEDFLEGHDKKYILRNGGNIYNGEYDLTQDFAYRIFDTAEEDNQDWIYTHDNTIVVINVHTGCDIRGGYGRPLFCTSLCDYSFPDGLRAEYIIDECRLDGEVLDGQDVFDLSESWQSGYTPWPYGELEDDVERWFEWTRTRDTVVVLLTSGHLCRIRAVAPYSGQ